jgi:uncharacterized repeat protein (TIGR03803 family)
MRIARTLVLCLLPSLAAASVAHTQPVAQVELLHAFRAAPGNPVGGLARAADGSFYGLTARLLYRVTSGGALSVAHTFDASATGGGAPTIAPDGIVYGTVTRANRVEVFRFDPATSAFRILHTFDTARDGHSMPDEYGRRRHSLVFGPDGQLYGTTGGDFPDATPERYGTIYRVHPITGAGTTVHEFSGAAPALRNPIGGLVAAGGQLYGAARFGGISGPMPRNLGQGGIYRLDPTTGTVTTVHVFSGATGRNPMVGLTRTSDGLVYGTAFQNLPAGSTILTHVFRFSPPSGALEVVAEPGVDPSQLVEAGDGHLYGVTELIPRIFRVRRGPGGAHTVETVHDATATDGVVAAREALSVGLDGSLYGTALAGTVFKVDTLSQFAVVHDFPQTGHNWLPSVPMRVANGDLYGTTSRGGATLRGSVYRIDGTTGALAILGPMPGALDPQAAIANSALVAGSDGLLYGTATNGVVRVDPGNGAIAMVSGWAFASGEGFTVGPAGRLYAIQEGGNVAAAAWFDVNTGVAREIARLQRVADRGHLRTSRLALGADGQLYLGVVQVEPMGGPFAHIATLVRLDLASNAFVTVADLGNVGGGSTPPPVVGTPVAAPNGTLLVPLRDHNGVTSVLEVTPATGSVRTACAPFGPQTTLGADGALYGVDGRLRRCDVSTGATVEQPLVDSVGEAQAPPALLAGVIHGATVGGLYGGGTVFRLNGGGLPAIDTDGDGLSNIWEATYGLDPFRTDGAHGAAADPDGDGRTNAQELADGTHPNGIITRYFAEGATGPFFRTRLDLANPGVGGAAVLLRFLTDTGARISRAVVIPPGSHASIDPATIAGLAHATFSTVVEADVPIAVDRTMSWAASSYGTHIETGVTAPATTWYLAEGSTSGPFALFYLLQNPQASAVTATVRYLRPFGLPPIEKTYTLLPESRTTIVVDGEGAELASTDVSAVITASSPIVAERAMYYSQPGQPFAAGHESAGVTAPALEWFLAEGATGAFFDLFVLIANPNPTAAVIEVEYLLVGGGSLTKTYTIAASSRSTIWVDDEELPAGSGTKPLANAALSMTVRSTNSVPIVVERTMWWPGPALTTNYWYESHNSPGATTTATRWLVAGADIGGADSAQTYLLIANPGATAARARLSVLTKDGMFASGADMMLPPKSRTSVPFTNPISLGASAVVGILVESVGTTPVPIVVEHANYSSPGGVIWASGGNALAAPLP